MSAATAPATKGRTTEGCRYCWMCRQACPVGHVTARETLTPHAWALLIESVARNQLSWTRESVDVIYACADCGLCQSHCVTDQPLPAAINSARVDLVSSGAAPAAVYEFDKRLKARGNAQAGVPRVGDVALFVGDAAGPETADVEAVRRLLAAAGFTVVEIGGGRSSGLAACALGLRDTAEELAAAIVAEVRASTAREVMVLGPGDRWTFETMYGERLGVVWPAGVAVREVVDVLADAHARGRLRLGRGDIGAYAYHDPCHAPRVSTQRPAPRALLASVFGADHARNLFWREHRAHPCGAVGGLDLTHPDIAGKLADRRLADAVDEGAATLVTEDPRCLRHLRSRQTTGILVKGLYELLADRL